MARTKGGSAQTLSVGGTTISGPKTGFSGLQLAPAASTFTNTSGGLEVVENAGTVVRTGSFSVLEFDASNTALLGKNAAREELIWRPDGPTGGTQTFDAVLAVGRGFADRGARSYDVSLTVDGDIAHT